MDDAKVEDNITIFVEIVNVSTRSSRHTGITYKFAGNCSVVGWTSWGEDVGVFCHGVQ